MQMWIPVALGGAAGALARYGAILTAARLAPLALFPYATATVNLLGCFAIGALHAGATQHGWFSPTVRVGLMTGFLGAFTTYSTFAQESVLLLTEGHRPIAALSIALHLVGGLACVALGHALVARA